MKYFSAYLPAHHKKSYHKGHDTFEEQSQEVGIYSQERIHCRIDVEDIGFLKQGKERISELRQPTCRNDAVQFLIEKIAQSS
jgi:hypothetical protein